MNFQQKNIYVSFLTMLILLSIYYWKVSDLHAAGAFDGPEGIRLIGKAILVLMAGWIVLLTVGTVLSSILYSKLTNTPEPSFLIDERDREIELRSIRVGYFTTGAGFVLAMIALATGWSIFAVFQILIAGCAVSALAEAATQFILYRRAV